MRRNVRQRLSPFAAGVIAIVVILVACYFGFTKSNPFANRFELSAAFETVNDIKKGSPVRIAGVKVGKVVRVETVDPTSVLGVRGGGGIVHMEIEKNGLPIHADATMKVRPRIFLEGNWFVDVHPGSPSAPAIAEGTTVPITRTSAPVQFGQILTALQSDTRQDLQIVLDEYGRALADGGAKAYNRGIRWWERAFRSSAIVSEAMLGTEEHDLTGYLRGGQKFAAGLDRDPQALKDLLTDFATTADAFASEETNLTAAIRELPLTLIVGQSSLGKLNDAFPSLRRFAAAMRPAVRSSGPALDATLPLIRQLRGLMQKSELRGLVKDLRPTVKNLTELNVGGVPLQKELRLLSSCGNQVLIPWRNDKIEDPQFPASGPVYEEQVKWLPGIAAESRNFDANGQYVRSLANGFGYAYGLGDGRFGLTGMPLQGVNPPKVTTSPPYMPDVDCETQQPPDLRSRAAAPPRAIKVDHNNPASVARRNAKLPDVVEYMRKELELIGEDTPVRDTWLRPEELKQLTKAIPVKP